MPENSSSLDLNREERPKLLLQPLQRRFCLSLSLLRPHHQNDRPMLLPICSHLLSSSDTRRTRARALEKWAERSWVETCGRRSPSPSFATAEEGHNHNVLCYVLTS